MQEHFYKEVTGANFVGADPSFLNAYVFTTLDRGSTGMQT
jgi:hypothetical protein